MCVASMERERALVRHATATSVNVLAARRALGVPDKGDYILYVGSGRRWHGDFAEHLRMVVYVVCVDIRLGAAEVRMTFACSM